MDEAPKRELVRQHGPWTGYNIDLGDGVWTIGPGLAGVAEARVGRVLQLVTDLSRRDLSTLRILDLGSHEGGFAVELAAQGADVTAIEARADSVAKATAVKEALSLDRLTVIHEDVRNLRALGLGTFDVVICLGLLYHLEPAALFDFAEAVAGSCEDFAIFETQVSLSAKATHDYRGRTFAGRYYTEDLALPGASVRNPESFWLTKPSLLNLLQEVGFTSVAECMNPVIPALAAARDHVTLVAIRGRPVAVETVDNTSVRPATWPEVLPTFAHPQQGLRYAIEERIRRRRGGGLGAIFKKRTSPPNE